MFISHPDFASLKPINVYHPELDSEGKSIFERDDESDPILAAHPAHLRNRHIIYRKRMTLPTFSKAVLRITADDYYKLYLNGTFVTEGPTAGYPHAYFYNEIDVTDHLREGENIFAAHTYYQGLINRVWVSGDLRQMLWCELYLDGERVLESDESFLCGYHRAYTECGMLGYETVYNECYDARSADVGFEELDFDDSDFVPAVASASPDWVLLPQPTRMLDIYDALPERTEAIDGGIRLYFSTEAVGTLAFTAEGRSGDEVIIRYGEELDSDGAVRFDMRCNCRCEERMILSGGIDRLRQYDYKAFRYAELLYPDGVRLSDVRMTVRHYPYEEKFCYRTDDERLRAVLALCRNTVKYSTQDKFSDCPIREKGTYLGDLMVSGRAHAILTGDFTMLKHAVRGFLDSAVISDGIMAVSRCSFMQDIADYSLVLPALVNWIYREGGDRDFLIECEPYMTRLYEYFCRYERADGLVERVWEWNMVDWPMNLRDGYDFPLTKPIGYGVHNVINALWYGLKLAMAELYATLGMERDFGAEMTKKAYIEAFYSARTGLYTDSADTEHSAVHSSVFALLFGIGTENGTLKRALVDHIASKRLTSMGVYTAYFALAALKLAGEYELAHELATDSGAWLNMISEGATMTFEAWGKEQKWNTSLCHPWAVAPLIIFADGVSPYWVFNRKHTKNRLLSAKILLKEAKNY
jgi:hypothetical protein